MATVADSLIRTLKSSGVRRIYGVPGDSLNGLTDAIRRDGDIAWEHVRDGDIAWEHVRNEEVGAFAAGAEAAATGEIAVCVGSCGPGNVHLINGLYDAQRSRVPVLAIAAQIPRTEIGSAYFQETHPESLFEECSVYCELVSTPEQFPVVLQQALQQAITLRGVGVIVVPGEVFLADQTGHDVPGVHTLRSMQRPDEAALTDAAAIINAAERPTILAGAGCEGAHDQLMALAGKIKAPIVHSLRGKEFVEWDNPYDVGMTGLIGYDSGYRAMEHCDALIMLGTDFPYRQFYPEDVPVVQVDIRGENIGRRVRVTHPLVGSVKDTVDAWLPHLRTKTDSAFLDKVVSHYVKRRAKLDELAEPGSPTQSPIHPQTVAAAVNDLAADDAMFTCDVGTPTVWLSRYIRTNGQRRIVGSFNHGSMASALAQGIGLQASHPDRQVVALAGDGGLAMLLGDLITLRQRKLPVKIVVFNNNALSFVELEMKQAGLVNFGTDLDNPDFVGIAQAVGLHGVRAQQAGDVRGAIQEALEYDGPALVDATVARQELSMPPKITAAQVKGFTLFAARTILSGRGSELIEVAKTNLRQL